MRAPVAGMAGAAAISGLGTGMTLLAIPWFVLATTGSATHTGAVIAAETAGLLAGSTVGGPWIDRLGPRRAAVCFDLAAALVVTTIPLLHHLHLLTAPLLAGLAALLGATRGPGDAARLVLVPAITATTGTPVERVTAAHDTPAQAARALGAPIARWLIATTGAPAVLLLDAASFALAAAITRALLPETTHHTPEADHPRGLRPAWRFLRRQPTLRAITLMAAAANGFNTGLLSVLVPAYGMWVLGSPADTGALYATTGAAMIAGTLMFTTFGLRLPRRPVIAACFLLVLAPRSAIFLLHPPMTLLVITSAALMLAFGPLNPIIAAVRTELTPPHLRARVFATISATATLAMPLGTITAGALADRLGLLPALGVFTAAGALLSLCPLLPAWRELDSPTQRFGLKLRAPGRATSSQTATPDGRGRAPGGARGCPAAPRQR